VAVLFAAVGALLVTSSSTHSAASAAVVEPSPAALSHYAVFRRNTVPSDEIPPVNLLESSTALSRALPARVSGYSQWATLEGDKLCVVARFTPAGSPNGAPDTNRACNSVQYLEDHQELITQSSLVGSSSTPPPPGLANIVSGLTPDGVSAVTLNFTDGSRQTLSVEDNGFIYSLGSSPKTLEGITWTDSSGQTMTEKS
jgi:hypothetical protein